MKDSHSSKGKERVKSKEKSTKQSVKQKEISKKRQSPTESRKAKRRQQIRRKQRKDQSFITKQLNALGCGENAKLILGVGAGVIFILILGFCVYAAYNASQSSDYSICNLAEAEPDSFLINQCNAEKCLFDISQCDFSCPFGFQSANNCPVSCECSADGLFEGDIQFNEKEVPYMLEDYGYVDESSDLSIFAGGSVSKSRSLWGDDIIGELFYIFYIIDEDPGESIFSSSKFKYAVKDFDRRTCIRFRPKGNNEVKYFITFSSKNTGCWSAIGKETGDVRNQTVNIGSGCNQVQIIQHQLLHTLGFRHEQARSDRDDFVVINPDNIKSGNENDFQKMRITDAQDLGSSYDYTSITHFSTFAFTQNGKPTITLKSGEQFIKRSKLMSDDDIFELNRLYPCPSKGGEQVEGSVTHENKGEVRFKPRSTITNGPISEWGFWGPWTTECECKEGYHGPVKLRLRSCPDGVGKCGEGTGRSDVFDCVTKTCPNKTVNWTEWTSWTNCTATCNDNGIVIRVRACDGIGCVGKASSTKACTGYCEPTTTAMATTAKSTTTTTTTTESTTTTAMTTITGPTTTTAMQTTMEPTTTTAIIITTMEPTTTTAVTTTEKSTTAQTTTISTTAANTILNPTTTEIIAKTLPNTTTELPTTEVVTTTTTATTKPTTTTTTTPFFVITTKSTTPFSSLPGEINAQWGPWGEYSPCATTCGNKRYSTCSRQRTCLRGRFRDQTTCKGDEQQYKYCYILTPCNMTHAEPKFNEELALMGGSSGLMPGVDHFCGVKKPEGSIIKPIVFTTLPPQNSTSPAPNITTSAPTTTTTTPAPTTTKPATTTVQVKTPVPTTTTVTTPVPTTTTVTTPVPTTTTVTTPVPTTTTVTTFVPTTTTVTTPVLITSTAEVTTPLPTTTTVTTTVPTTTTEVTTTIPTTTVEVTTTAPPTTTEPTTIAITTKEPIGPIKGIISFKLTPVSNMKKVLCQNADYRSPGKLSFGDFNGDGRIDVICEADKHLDIALTNIDGSINELHWTGKVVRFYCQSDDENISADFNGDGVDDFLCRGARHTAIHLSSNGEVGPEVYNEYFCGGGKKHTVLLAPDVNGDGKADLLCKTIRDETFEIKINQYV